MRIGGGRFARFRNVSGLRQAKFSAKCKIMHRFFCAGDRLIPRAIERVARLLRSRRNSGEAFPAARANEASHGRHGELFEAPPNFRFPNLAPRELLRISRRFSESL
jgi:hypothetical protein